MFGLTTKKKLAAEKAKNVEFYKTGLRDGQTGKRSYNIVLLAIQRKIDEMLEAHRDEVRSFIQSLDLKNTVESRMAEAVQGLRDDLIKVPDEVKEQYRKVADEGVFQGSQAVINEVIKQVLRIMDVRTLYKLAKEKDDEESG